MPTAKKITKKKAKTESAKDGSFVPNQTVQGFAIIETGGKQYRVAIGDTINIEKVNENGKEYKEGDVIVFDKILLIDNGAGSTDIGTPYIGGAKISGTLIEIGRNAKVTVIKYKQKSRYFKKNGHRQPYFKVRIDKI